MPSESPDERKAALRAGARGARGRERTGSAEAALARLLELAPLGAARVAAFYAAIGDEVPVEAAAAACRGRGALVVYPVVAGPELELAPDPAKGQRIDVARVDVFVVPGLLFDRSGRRLGRGGGHYDRLLARRRTDAVRIGICYADRVVAELPEDPWDVAMDWIVTDQFVLRAAR